MINTVDNALFLYFQFKRILKVLIKEKNLELCIVMDVNWLLWQPFHYIMHLYHAHRKLI